ncbi:MAG TPA: hypothetical protein VM910_31050 [Bradyrhizobium sp.]|nr:hypothetical protein [Bradyrhizobium sp.]
MSLDVGRWLFGPTSSGGGVSAAGGGLPLPDFTNWRAGLTFTYRVFKLGLNYTDTNLSKENCYVLTGDLGALPGGVANPGPNPFGFALGPVRRDVLGNAWFRHQSCDARPLTTSCASRFSARTPIGRDGFAAPTHRPRCERGRLRAGRFAPEIQSGTFGC